MGIDPPSKPRQSIIVDGPGQRIIANQNGGSFQSVIIGPPFPRPAFPPPFYPPPPPFCPQPFYPQPVYRPSVNKQTSYDDDDSEYVPPKEIKKYVDTFKNKDLRNSKVNIDWVK